MKGRRWEKYFSQCRSFNLLKYFEWQCSTKLESKVLMLYISFKWHILLVQWNPVCDEIIMQLKYNMHFRISASKGPKRQLGMGYMGYIKYYNMFDQIAQYGYYNGVVWLIICALKIFSRWEFWWIIIIYVDSMSNRVKTNNNILKMTSLCCNAAF